MNNLISKVNNFVPSLINWSSDWLTLQWWYWQRGHQGGHLPPCPPSQGLCPHLPPLEERNGQNQLLSAKFWIFAALEMHFAPSMLPPPTKKFLVPPLDIGYFHIGTFTIVHDNFDCLIVSKLGPYFDAGYPVEPKTHVNIGNDGRPLWHKLALPNCKWISVDNLFFGMADNVMMWHDKDHWWKPGFMVK